MVFESELTWERFGENPDLLRDAWERTRESMQNGGFEDVVSEALRGTMEPRRTARKAELEGMLGGVVASLKTMDYFPYKKELQPYIDEVVRAFGFDEQENVDQFVQQLCEMAAIWEENIIRSAHFAEGLIAEVSGSKLALVDLLNAYLPAPSGTKEEAESAEEDVRTEIAWMKSHIDLRLDHFNTTLSKSAKTRKHAVSLLDLQDHFAAEHEHHLEHATLVFVNTKGMADSRWFFEEEIRPAMNVHSVDMRYLVMTEPLAKKLDSKGQTLEEEYQFVEKISLESISGDPITLHIYRPFPIEDITTPMPQEPTQDEIDGVDWDDPDRNRELEQEYYELARRQQAEMRMYHGIHGYDGGQLRGDTPYFL